MIVTYQKCSLINSQFDIYLFFFPRISISCQYSVVLHRNLINFILRIIFCHKTISLNSSGDLFDADRFCTWNFECRFISPSSLNQSYIERTATIFRYNSTGPHIVTILFRHKHYRLRIAIEVKANNNFFVSGRCKT